MDLTNYLWSERYRPKTIEDVVIPENFRKNFKRFISEGQIPNMIFEGPAGSGKTTCAMILCSPEGILSDPDSNRLFVSGSSKSTRGIGYVDTVIKGFIKNPPIGSDKIRVVLIDEADNMSEDAYKELRSLATGAHLKTSRFLLTCNYPSRIPYPVRSRLTPYKFKQLSKDYVLSYCSKILTSESIKFDQNVVINIIKSVYPDVRRIVNILQDNSSDGKLDIDPNSINIYENQVITLYRDIITSFQQSQKNRMNESMNNLINLITNNEIDYSEVYQKLFQEIPRVPLKIVINKYCNSHNNALIPWMHFQAMVYESLTALHKHMVLSKKLQGINTYQK
jgi:replication factor C small subunit